jgi:hypothetical protein
MPIPVATFDEDLAQRIIFLLGQQVSASMVDIVQDSLAEITELQQYALVAKINVLVAQLEGLDASLDGGLDQAGLIQAGDLKWADGARLTGFSDRRSQLLGRLAGMLSLEEYLVGGGTDQSLVMRVHRG